MNETKTENTDRFYKPLGEMSGSKISHCGFFDGEIEDKTNTIFDNSKEYTMLEYAPEPLHMTESKVKHLKFTVGNKYPVIEKRHECSLGNKYPDCLQKAGYEFKTLNDKQETVWVDEKYFIPSSINLTHEVAVGGFMPKKDNLDWDAAAEDGIVNLCDIRKMASEKNIKPLDLIGDGSLMGMMAESLTLSGCCPPLSDCKYEGTVSCSTGFGHNNLWTCNEGIVKDTGNDLMNNATKCMAAIDKVFGAKKIVDPDAIITAIRTNVPHLCLQWENDVLCVNGAQTKITYSEVQTAYSGLKGIVSARIAERTIGRLVASQLKKVF